ncbi:DUF3006 domain-containing protein [Haloferax denitrificans]|uniref:DUF3006 domain-containing protein n=1 Tax=Haloferax denitrificans ATCC 35960 TaxID=662478 RepID=M0IY17_9EURY|nr:DUF3006 domain-containing protein [Haloferax denitrificans]EMA01611.1 hypothetical protein C438_14681 [Haloferax denitrificans ATCC 35960]
MIPDGTYTATVDRFEDDRAVLLVEADGRDIDQLVVDRDELPWRARSQNAVLTISVAEGEYDGGRYEPDETDARTNAAQSRFDRLSRRPPAAANEDDEDS